MKRNTALFGASLVAGVAAASGLMMTSTASSAAPGDTFYGVAWADGTSGETSGGWTTGAYADPYGVEFSGNATAGSGTFKLAAGGSTVTVTTTCVAGKPSVRVAGGGAAGVHTGGSVSLATFTGAADAVGTVTFAAKASGHVAGAYINLSPGLDGTYVALAGADCEADAPTSSTTSSSTTSSSTTNPPSSSSTTTPPSSSSTTNPPSSSTTAPPTSTGTNPPTTTPTTPPTTTPPPTTEPPTPTPTTTTLPVTG